MCYVFSELVNTGLLAVRTASSYWFSVPSVGMFMKTYLKGRKAVMASVRKAKYSEILLPVSKLINCKKKLITISEHYGTAI